MGNTITVNMNLMSALNTKDIEEVVKCLKKKANVNYDYPVSQVIDFVSFHF